MSNRKAPTASAIFVSFLLIFTAFSSSANECSLSHLKFEKKSDKKVLIVPSGRLGNIVSVLMKEYLSQVKGITPLLVQKNKNDFVIRNFIKVEKSGYYLKSLVTSFGENKEIVRFEGSFDFPTTLNKLLLDFVEKVSPLLGKKRLPQKKLLPYLNQTHSQPTYLAYADGYWALERAFLEPIEKSRQLNQKAMNAFQKAIQNDYNYIPAYLKLAESLATEVALRKATGENTEALSLRATTELKKGELLNPVLTKVKKKKIMRLLKTGRKELCRS